MTIAYEVNVDHDLAFVVGSVEFLEDKFRSSTEKPKWLTALLRWIIYIDF